MSTTICFDFGNTRLKYAVIENGNVVAEQNLLNDNSNSILEVIQQYKPQKSILSSVIHHNTEIENILAENTVFHKLNHQSVLNVVSPVGKPETIGADRLAICSAAVHLFPHQHNLAIALGTCITYNFINNKHQFLGGSISPGMHMRFKAMHEHTALLPLEKAEHNFPLIGYDTKTNLQSGVILGISKEIDGIIDAYKENYSKFNVLLTGGDMGFFVPQLKNKIFANPYLIYTGLYAISELNNP
jgi:type III pantothenate kinase